MKDKLRELEKELGAERQAHAWTAARLADSLLKERELLALADELEEASGKVGRNSEAELRWRVADKIRSILRLPE